MSLQLRMNAGTVYEDRSTINSTSALAGKSGDREYDCFLYCETIHFWLVFQKNTEDSNNISDT